MQVTIHELTVPLGKPFTISRGTLTEQQVLIVELEQDGITGLGEVTANDYYGHTLPSIRSSIEAVAATLQAITIERGDEIYRLLSSQLSRDTFALAALDIACQDLAARSAGLQCHEHWGLTWDDPVPSSYTLGIGSVQSMVADLEAHPGWQTYKIKLGTDHDLEIVRALRQATDATFRVDANCAWTADEAIFMSGELAELGVEFIEQPLPPDAGAESFQQVHHFSKLPILADESCLTPPDVRRCAGTFHGINVKLCKCGGLTPALAMLKEAKELGLKTMIGCMVETSIGISAAAQLLPLLDYADLDGALLLRDDPADGVAIQVDGVQLGNRLGIGARLKEPGGIIPRLTSEISHLH